MPFQLLNILASFNNLINKIIVKKFDIFVIIYLGNIFIYTKNESQAYIETVR